MKSLRKFSLAFLLGSSLISQTALAETQPTSTSQIHSSIIRQQMILLGLYVFGINTELSKKVIKADEIKFLAENIIDIGKEISQTKRDKNFHKNLDDMLAQARILRDNAGDQKIAREKGQALLDACAKCHWEGSR